MLDEAAAFGASAEAVAALESALLDDEDEDADGDAEDEPPEGFRPWPEALDACRVFLACDWDHAAMGGVTGIRGAEVDRVCANLGLPREDWHGIGQMVRRMAGIAAPALNARAKRRSGGDE